MEIPENAVPLYSRNSNGIFKTPVFLTLNRLEILAHIALN